MGTSDLQTSFPETLSDGNLNMKFVVMPNINRFTMNATVSPEDYGYHCRSTGGEPGVYHIAVYPLYK